MFADRIRQNIGWKTIGIVIEKSLRFLMVALITRSLGPKMYGQYTYAVALALLCVQITDMGLGLFLAREVSRHEVPPARLIGHVFTLRAVLAIGYILLMGVLTWWHFVDPQLRASVTFHPRPGHLGWTVALAGLAGLATSTIEGIWQVFRGIQRMDLEARSGSFFAFSQLGCVMLGLWGLQTMPVVAGDKAAVMVLIAAAMLVSGVMGLIYTFYLLLRVVTPQFGWSREMVRRFAREVLPLGVAIVASLIYFKIDVPILRMLRGDTEVGLYNAAYKFLENMSVIPAILLAATFPALSHTVEFDPLAAQRLHRNTLRVLLVAALIGSVAFLTLPALMIGVLNGPEYSAAVPVLRALAPSVFLTFINYLETHMLVALGLVKAQMAFAMALILVNVLANFALIPQYGGVGAALATALTEVVLLGFCAPMVHRELRKRIADHALSQQNQATADIDNPELK